jgi:signal transduction histidine kinase
VSYLADSVLLFRYFEADGRVRKALSVVKKRSGVHESTIRELVLGPEGVRVGGSWRSFAAFSLVRRNMSHLLRLIGSRQAVTGDETVAVLAPTARDGPLTIQILAQGGIEGVLAHDVNELCRMLEGGAAAALIAEEALSAGGALLLARQLERQEPWSDLPLIIFGAKADPGDRRLSVESLAPYGNVVLLDRPVATITLLSSVRAALRARRRQYAARDVLENLAAALRSRDRFLAVLGHELRNPLGAMMTASALLDLPQRDSAGPRAIIARQTRAPRLVDDLLEVSRITSGKISLQPVPVDLREVVRRSVELVELSSNRVASGIRLSLLEGPVTVEGIGASRAGRGNLLSNAVKYTPAEGAIFVEVETAAEISCDPGARQRRRHSRRLRGAHLRALQPGGVGAGPQ